MDKVRREGTGMKIIAVMGSPKGKGAGYKIVRMIEDRMKRTVATPPWPGRKKPSLLPQSSSTKFAGGLRVLLGQGLLFRYERKSDQSRRGKSNRRIHDEYLGEEHGPGQRRLARSEEERRIRSNCEEKGTPDPKAEGLNPLSNS
jgi:hypothetical protein